MGEGRQASQHLQSSERNITTDWPVPQEQRRLSILRAGAEFKRAYGGVDPSLKGQVAVSQRHHPCKDAEEGNCKWVGKGIDTWSGGERAAAREPNLPEEQWLPLEEFQREKGNRLVVLRRMC